MWAHPEEAVQVVDTREAFEEFARDRSAHLFRLALRLSGWNEASAQDLLQIALERAYGRRWLLFRDAASAEPSVRRGLVDAAVVWRGGGGREGGSVTIAAAIGVAAALTGLPGWSGPAASRGNSNAAHRAPVFPGGGRLLFADSGGLKWLYPDGKAVRIASGFSSAEVNGPELV